jgi:DNA-binding IclR family transcriptional regulator
VKSSERTIDVLEYLAATDDEPTLTAMARTLDVPKSSLHKLLATLENRGWVETDVATHTRYRLGLRALLVGTRYLEGDRVVQSLEPVLMALSEKYQEATHLGRLDGADVVYLSKKESTHPFRMYSAVGRRLPAHATAMGKAMLSLKPWAEVDALLPEPLPALTPSTITDRDTLRLELETIAARGYAIDDEESAELLRAVAVPLRFDAESANAISISAPTMRLEMSSLAAIAQTMNDLLHARVGSGPSGR